MVAVACMAFWPITTNYFRVPFLQRREFEGWLVAWAAHAARGTHLAHGKARRGGGSRNRLTIPRTSRPPPRPARVAPLLFIEAVERSGDGKDWIEREKKRLREKRSAERITN